MAARNARVSSQQEEIFDPAEKIQQSNTLKRHPKMDLNKNDLLRLLSYLEGELQARDVVIATLKAEKAKQLLYQAKYGRFGLGDPFVALQRDSDNMKDNSFDETAIKCMYDNQLAQLENLIATQRKAQLKMREQLAQVEKRYHKVLNELEEEKRKHAQDTAQGDDVTYMLEKERERLKQEVDYEKAQNRRMEKDLKKTLASLEEERANSAKHKQVALMLIRERRKLVERILQEKHKCSEMEHILNDEKDKMISMAEGLVQESRKSLKMEAAMEKQLSEFDTEREQLRTRVIREENKNKELQSEADSLRQQVDELHRKLLISENVKDDDKNTGTPLSSCSSSRESSTDRTISVAQAVTSVSKTVHIPPASIVLDNSTSTMPLASSDGKKSALQFNSNHSPSSPEKRPISPGEMFSPVSDIRIVSDGSTGNRISVSAGGTTVVSTSGGKISFQIGQSSGPTRKSVSVGRGTPPPIPPNKPVLVASTAGGGKPAVPPKMGITVSKDRLTVSGSESDSSLSGSSCNNPKAMQIPVSVVTSQSSVPSSRTSKESSPLRKTTQSVELSSSPPLSSSSSLSSSKVSECGHSGFISEPLSSPISFSSSFTSSSTPSPITSSTDSLEFLNPEMAQLHQVLVSLTTADKSDTDCLNIDLASIITTTTTTTTTNNNNNNINNNNNATTTTTTAAASPSTFLKRTVKPSLRSLFSPSSPPSPPKTTSTMPNTSSVSSSSPSFLFSLVSSLASKQSQLNKHAASGNLHDLQMLLDFHHKQYQHENKDLEIVQTSIAAAMVYAAQSGQQECLKLLLKYVSSDCASEMGFYPLHAAAKNGHQSCLEVLLDSGANVNSADPSGWIPLEWAAASGYENSCKFLLNKGSILNLANKENMSTIFHHTARSGNTKCLEILLLNLNGKKVCEENIPSRETLTEVVNRQNEDGKTVCHLAAMNESEDCLEMILKLADADLLLTDKQEQSVYDVASPACHYFLSHKTKVPNRKCSVILQLKQFLDISNPGKELKDNKISSDNLPAQVLQFYVGSVNVQPITSWIQFQDSLHNTLRKYYRLLDYGFHINKMTRPDSATNPEQTPFTLGFSLDNIKKYSFGSYDLYAAQEFPSVAPYDLISENCEANKASISITIEDTDLSSMSLAFSLLIPHQTIQSYFRLLDQYKNVVFYGPHYTQKKMLAQQIARFIAAKEAKEGRFSSIIYVNLHPNYTKQDITKLLMEFGCMVPIKTENTNQIARILILEGLDKINIPDVLHDLLEAIEHRGQRYTFKVASDDDTSMTCFLVDRFYVIGTMDKLRLSGLKVSVQQRFRWVQFRVNMEPIAGLLARHLLRSILQCNHGKLPAADDPVFRVVDWVICIWQKLNDSILKLGLHDAIMGPSLFMSCPVQSGNPEAIYQWFKVIWNEKISPAVYQATVSNHSLMKENISGNNYEKVAHKALYVLLQRSVFSDSCCPLIGQEKSSYLKEFIGHHNSDGFVKTYQPAQSYSDSSNQQEQHPFCHTFHIAPICVSTTTTMTTTTTASSTSPLSPCSPNVAFSTLNCNGNTNEENDLADWKNLNMFSSKRSLPDSLGIKKTCDPLKDPVDTNESCPKMRKLEIRSPESIFDAGTSSSSSSSSPTSSKLATRISFSSPSIRTGLSFFRTKSGNGSGSSVDNNNGKPSESRKSFSDETLSSPRERSKRNPSGSFTFSLASPPPTLNSFKFLETGPPMKLALSCEQRERQQQEPAPVDIQLIPAVDNSAPVDNSSTPMETVHLPHPVNPPTTKT